MNKFIVWLRDAAEQALVAFGGVLLVLWPTDIADVNVTWGHKLYVAGGAALLVVGKGLLAKLIGNGASTSVQPNLPADQVKADPPTDNIAGDRVILPLPANKEG